MAEHHRVMRHDEPSRRARRGLIGKNMAQTPLCGATLCAQRTYANYRRCVDGCVDAHYGHALLTSTAAVGNLCDMTTATVSSRALLHDLTRRPLTAPQLFARYEPQGDETCFYCGGQCDQTHAAKDVVKSSFTGLDTVTLSSWVCVGCVDAMQEGIDLQLIDGTRKSNQKTRGYSWIITATDRKACTKAHRVELLDACINPPSTPFVVCISDSGQKHLLYRSVVNASREMVTVTLELEQISYRPSDLAERIKLTKQVCAATGKPAMQETMSPQTLMRIVDYYESEEILEAWLGCYQESLTRLAIWLTPAKSECEIEYPKVT